MIFVALLRGINVGGRNKIDMKELKRTFESVGMKSVITYINSGNVIFEYNEQEQSKITSILKQAILKSHGLEINIQVRSRTDFSFLMESLPDHWKNDKQMKGDVLFLTEEIDNESILTELTIKPTIDRVFYVPGALMWSVDRDQVTRSGMMKLASSPLYKKMTIRNVNTTRQLFKLMNEVSS